jgi:hypothetical protein
MPLNQTAIDAIIKTRTFYQFPTEVDNVMLVGYSYNLDINLLAVDNVIIEDYFVVGITQHKAEILLKLECYRYEHQLQATYSWFADIDDVSKFAVIAFIFAIGAFGNLTSHKKLLTMIEKCNYGDAAMYLKKMKVHDSIISILKTGKFR